ncbi:MAG TPA: DUF2946 family protein [Steroidobacteraceae bacterium]|nr:DUF2946 family protein [Steroidobacteraceae bacterium]
MGRVRHPSTPLLPTLSGRRSRTRLLPGILLVFALRALIPLGFMPASDGTLSLMICPGGLPLALLPQEKTMQDGMGTPMPQPHHHGHGVMEDGFCAFTTGCSPAPPPLPLLAVLALLAASLGVALTHLAAPGGSRLVHVPQARAPPAAA